MKKLLFILSLSFSSVLFAQERNGITYQALIVDPSGEFLPGADNNYSPLKNTSVCLQFHIIDSTNSYEYSEQHTVTTDNFGMVNLVIGTGSAIGGVGWENVSWSASAKSLKVDVDKTGSCSSFEELSNQPLTSVPFALYSPGSDTPGPQGDPGEEGMSAYEVWLDLGNTGTEQDFIDSLKGPEGDPGDPGADGDSGDPGADGDSAYDIWIAEGNTGTEQEFLDSLKATDGNDGDSAYDIWIAAGNTGTEQEFLDSLKGPKGDPGEDASSNFSGSSFSSSNSDSTTEYYNTYVSSSSSPQLSKTGNYVIFGSEHYDYNSNALDRGVVQITEFTGSKMKEKITSFGQEFYENLPGNTQFKFFGVNNIISGDGSRVITQYLQDGLWRVKILDIDYSLKDWLEIDDLKLDTANAGYMGEPYSFMNYTGDKFVVGYPDGFKEYNSISNDFQEVSNYDFNTSPQEAYLRAASDDLSTVVASNVYMTGGQFNELPGAGNVFVYKKNPTGWESKGQVIKGAIEAAGFGQKIDISSDGNIIAVLNGRRKVNDNNCNEPFVDCFIYSFDGSSWIQRGSVLTFSGNPINVQLSDDGNFVAVGFSGQVGNNNICGSTKSGDHIVFYEFDDQDWIQTGSVLKFINLKEFVMENGTLLMLDETGDLNPSILFKKLY